MLQLKPVIFEKTNQNFCFEKIGYVRKQKKQFSSNSDDETKNDLIRQKEKQLLSSFIELNSEKARWNFIKASRSLQ